MALFTGPVSVSSMVTFLESLQGFLTTGGAGNPGWTDEAAGGATYTGVDTTNGQWAVSKSEGSNHVQIAGQWLPATPLNLALYQYFNAAGAGSYVDGSNPWGQTNDSGNGYSGGTITNANLDDERHVVIGNTPIRYWCFTGDNPVYAYVVVETSSGVYVHFGFGLLEKYNDWTGGEFLYGHKSGGGQVITATASNFFLDGRASGTNEQNFGATVRIESVSDSPASGKWGVVMSDSQSSAQLGVDGASVARLHIVGGYRAGTHFNRFACQPGTISSAIVPSSPIVIYHFDRNVSGSSSFTNSWAPLGAMPGIRGLSIENFAPGDIVTIGSDDWYLFPTLTKYSGTGVITNTTGYAGVMYKANT